MNVLLLLFLTLLPGDEPTSPAPQDCSNLVITYSARVISDDVTINVEARGGVEPYFYFFFDAKDNPLTWDVKKSNYIVSDKNTPKYIKVFDSKGCSQRIEFNESTIK